MPRKTKNTLHVWESAKLHGATGTALSHIEVIYEDGEFDYWDIRSDGNLIIGRRIKRQGADGHDWWSSEPHTVILNGYWFKVYEEIEDAPEDVPEAEPEPGEGLWIQDSWPSPLIHGAPEMSDIEVTDFKKRYAENINRENAIMLPAETDPALVAPASDDATRTHVMQIGDPATVVIPPDQMQRYSISIRPRDNRIFEAPQMDPPKQYLKDPGIMTRPLPAIDAATLGYPIIPSAAEIAAQQAARQNDIHGGEDPEPFPDFDTDERPDDSAKPKHKA